MSQIIINPRWNKFASPLPWVAAFCKHISQSNLPRLDGSTVYIASDYSGYNNSSRYHVISILLADLDRCREWEIKRRRVRRNFIGDNRRMSFKNLNDIRRRRALIPFLMAADHIEGLCTTIVIHKDIKELCAGKHILERFADEDLLQGKWRIKTLENMLQVTQFVSILIAGLSKPYQNIYWISDQDQIFANPNCSADVVKMLSIFTSAYVGHKLGELGVGTTDIDEGDRFEEDFATVPDLAAGASAEIFTKVETEAGGIVGGIDYLSPTTFTKKTHVIANWLGDETQPLRRVTLLFNKTRSHQFVLTRIRQDRI